MDVNGLLPHTDNKNGDTKGGRGANTSADAGHRHDEIRKNWKTKGIEKQRASYFSLRCDLQEIRKLEDMGNFREQTVPENVCPRAKK
jgi:hypothetical protein